MNRFRVTCDDCPFDRTYDSQSAANRGLGLHSCERHRRLADLKARHEARLARIDRSPKPCGHKQANHQHGTYVCYTHDNCRCEPCAAAGAAYEANRLRQQAYGRWNGLVDAGPAREHIQSLMGQGMGLKRIVAVSDVAQGTLWKLMYGRRKPDGTQHPSVRITPDLERRILAIRLSLAAGQRVDGLGAARRIHALVALGWSQSKIAVALGIRPSNFSTLVHGRRPITVAHDQAVRKLYDAWSMKRPPAEQHRDKIAANRSVNYAKAHGWAPPLAWDDAELDNPDATPHRGVA